MELQDLPVETASNTWVDGQPVVIDFGSYNARFGMASSDSPSDCFPSVSAKYRDKKSSHTTLKVGAAALAVTAKNAIKFCHDGGLVANWDAVEHVFDYGFSMLGVTSEGSVDSPIILSEQMASPHNARNITAELMFEGYGVPKLATCVDALAAYNHVANDAPGIGVHLGNESAYITPFSPEAQLTHARRINWGGRQASEFMQSLMALKYPLFPTRLTVGQAGQIFRDCCYVSQDYSREMAEFLNLDYLSTHEKIVQIKPPQTKTELTQEQKEAQAERRRESGRRLQEQAAKARKEKLDRLEVELHALLELQQSDSWHSRFSSEEELEAEISRVKRLINPNEADPTEDMPPSTPLLEIPDGQLTPDQIKEKRRQRLLRANFDARMKIKAEKLAKTQQLEAARAADEEWRQRDLKGWIETKREQLMQVRKSISDRSKLRKQLNDRRSLASKMRMKSIVLLASGEAPSKKRKIKSQVDDFGADDDDWLIYNQKLDEDDGEEDEEKLRTLQQELLEHDPDFSLEELTSKVDWTKSVIHKFLYGAHVYDPHSLEQAYQLNVNVERIRVPEVLFQPLINGVDQAGITEVINGMLKTHNQITPNIYVTGGLGNLPGIKERIHAEIMANQPFGTQINVHVSSSPGLDAWKGMAGYDFSSHYITKKDYEEHGYVLKPNKLSNIF